MLKWLILTILNKSFKALLDINGKPINLVKTLRLCRVFLRINGKLWKHFATGSINAKKKMKVKSWRRHFKDATEPYKDGTAMTVKWLIDGLDSAKWTKP
jgi:hypothetical protein